MDNDFDFLFDEKVTSNLKNSFDDIEFTKDLKNKILKEALRKKTFKEKVKDFLNYEVELNVSKIGIVAALLVMIPTIYSINEGKKIKDNNIKIVGSEIADNKENSPNR